MKKNEKLKNEKQNENKKKSNTSNERKKKTLIFQLSATVLMILGGIEANQFA